MMKSVSVSLIFLIFLLSCSGVDVTVDENGLAEYDEYGLPTYAHLCEMDREAVELSGVVFFGTGALHGEVIWYAEVEGEVPQEKGDSFSINYEESIKIRFIEDFSAVRDLAEEHSVGSIEVYGIWSGFLGEVHPDCVFLRGDGYDDNRLFEINAARELRVVG